MIQSSEVDSEAILFKWNSFFKNTRSILLLFWLQVYLIKNQNIFFLSATKSEINHRTKFRDLQLTLSMTLRQTTNTVHFRKQMCFNYKKLKFPNDAWKDPLSFLNFISLSLIYFYVYVYHENKIKNKYKRKSSFYLSSWVKWMSRKKEPKGGNSWGIF